MKKAVKAENDVGPSYTIVRRRASQGVAYVVDQNGAIQLVERTQRLARIEALGPQTDDQLLLPQAAPFSLSHPLSCQFEHDHRQQISRTPGPMSA